MSHFSDEHQPTPEFRAQLKREIAQAFRGDLSAAAPVRTRRLAVAFGIAAGVVLTLATGVVLGASASYASAAVLDAHQREANTNVLAATRQLMAGQLKLARTNYGRVHGAFANGNATQNAVDVAAAQVDTLERTIAQIEVGLTASRATTPPARPALAMIPIKSALNALGCTPGSATPASPLATRLAVPTPEFLLDPTTTPVARRDPDRSKIAALAKEHAPGVARGDSIADYIVMVLDAADKYVWSTHGLGGLSVEVGGDTRPAAERVSYIQQHRAEYIGATTDAVAVDFVLRKDGVGYDSALKAFRWTLKERKVGDSLSLYFTYYDTLTPMRYRGAARAGGGSRGGNGGAVARGGGGARGGGDSAVKVLEPRRLMHIDGDSLSYWYVGAVGDRGTLTTGISPFNAPDGSYKIGWGGVRGGVTNGATGLEPSGNGQSGIQGVPSASVVLGESYVYPAGELALTTLRIVVMHLATGVSWKGR